MLETVNSADAPSRLAEEYMRLVMLTLAQHRYGDYALSQLSPLRGRLAALPTGIASRQVRAYGTVVRLVSIAEGFCSVQLASRLEAHVPSVRSPFIEELYYREESEAVRGWEQMKSRYKKWAGNIRLAECEGYATVMSLVEARNAIVHGLGKLTRRQLREGNLQATIDSLSAIEIVVDSNCCLQVSDLALKKGALGCRSFIAALDAELGKVH